MSLLVDDRSGSAELAKPLEQIGLSVTLCRLEFGDIAFEGRGKQGKLVTIGIEFKKLEELIASLRSERLQGYQLPGMRREEEGYDHSYLLIEGHLAYNTQGQLIDWTRDDLHLRLLPGQMTAMELLKRLYVLHLCGGLNPIWSQNRADTLKHIEALYRVWTDTDLDKHKSHLGIYVAPSLVPISAFRRTLTTFPGIGMRASLAAERHFGSLVCAVQATAKTWSEVTTTDDRGHSKKLGMKIAQRIVDFCRSGND